MKHFIFFSLLAVILGQITLAETQVVGQLGLVEGEVFLDARPVRKNAQVKEGATIEVKKGKATLLLGSGSVFHLGDHSKMIVSQYSAKTETKEESGQLDLKFGRTRALILNQGNEKKDLKIKARAATMGVRGTEIYIEVPKDASAPVQFFTLEGKAEVKVGPNAAPVALGQNQGLATRGDSKSASEVKAEIQNSGMIAPVTMTTGTAISASGDTGVSLNGAIGINSLPTIVFDPIQDRVSPISIVPQFICALAACP